MDNGKPAKIRYAVVDGVQIVRTHDCDHGLTLTTCRTVDKKMSDRSTIVPNPIRGKEAVTNEKDEGDFEGGQYF